MQTILTFTYAVTLICRTFLGLLTMSPNEHARYYVVWSIWIVVGLFAGNTFFGLYVLVPLLVAHTDGWGVLTKVLYDHFIATIGFLIGVTVAMRVFITG